MLMIFKTMDSSNRSLEANKGDEKAGDVCKTYSSLGTENECQRRVRAS